MRIEIRKPFRKTILQASTRDGFASAGVNLYIASVDPLRNGCFAEFVGFASVYRPRLPPGLVTSNSGQGLVARDQAVLSGHGMATGYLVVGIYNHKGANNYGHLSAITLGRTTAG